MQTLRNSLFEFRWEISYRFQCSQQLYRCQIQSDPLDNLVFLTTSPLRRLKIYILNDLKCIYLFTLAFLIK